MIFTHEVGMIFTHEVGMVFTHNQNARATEGHVFV